jgi:hypothetical protein
MNAMLPRRNTVSTVESAPKIQYFKGSALQEWRQKGTEDWQNKLAGFAAEVERYGDEFDAVCEQAGMTQVEVNHTFGRAKPQVVTYWWFGDTIDFFPLTLGPTSANIFGLLKHIEDTIEAGIGARWPEEVTYKRNGHEETRRGTSSVALQGYEKLLLEHGYAMPVQVGMTGPLTEDFINALLDHVRVCQIADQMKQEKTKDPDAFVALVELAWPLGASKKARSVGKEQTSRVHPMVSLHPDDPDRAYLKSIYATGELRETLTAAVERDWSSVVAWAREFARSGTAEMGPATSESNGASNGNSAPDPERKNAPQAVSDDDITDDDIPF